MPLSGQTSGNLTTDFRDGINQSSGTIGKEWAEKLVQSAKAATAAAVANELSWQAIVGGALTAVGTYKQYDALEKQGNLAEAQIGFGERNIKLAERNFDETVMPSYRLANDYFYNYYRKKFEPKLVDMINCGMRQCEYTEDYDRWKKRAATDSFAIMKGTRLSTKKINDCLAIGECFDNSHRFAELHATMQVATINYGRTYEDTLKLEKDKFYWNRYTTAADVIKNLGVLSSSMQKDAKSAVLSSLGIQNQAIEGLDRAVGSQMSALSQAGNFYGGIGGAYGKLLGSSYGNAVGQEINARPYGVLQQGTPVGMYGAQSNFTGGMSGDALGTISGGTDVQNILNPTSQSYPQSYPQSTVQ
jgi:hypothetical protein